MKFIAFSYCLDAAGDLIRLEAGQSASCLIPNAVQRVTSAHELKHPYPWTKTVADALSEIRFLPAPLIEGTIAESFYKSGQITTSDYLYVEPTVDFASDEQINALIELNDQVPVHSEESKQLIDALASVGIQRIPLRLIKSTALVSGTPVPNSTYHREGWISHSKVYRKAAWQ